MKILHLSTSDSGGAGRAAVRLHQALLKYGIDSQMLVQYKSTDLPTIHCLNQTKKQKIFSLMRSFLDQFPLLLYKNKTKDIFSSCFFPSNKTLLQKIKEINPDIIHLHWINSGFINIFDLQKINKPIIWSLHDANPYTGGCHVVESGCQFFKIYCHSCPFLKSNFKYDLSFFNFNKKRKAYKRLNLTINGLSRWITNEAKSSPLFIGKNIINLPNTIDTNIFRPIDKDVARDLIGINKKNKKIIGFGAVSATQVYRKGYSQLKEALEMLPNKENYTLVVFGSSQGENIAGIETYFLGHIYDDTTLKAVYSLFDVTLIPSLSESFGQIALESLACGTPVVCFKTTGLQDIITHKKDGYLAQPFLASELTEGVLWLSNLNRKEYENIQKNAIEKAKKFDYPIISKKYTDQYKKIISITNPMFDSKLKEIIFDRGGGDKIIGFGAVSATQVYRKGYSQLKEALEMLPNKENYTLVVFGSSQGENIAGIETYFLGHIYDDTTLAIIYNALDIFVTPSLAENLSNTIMESLSCGVPVVAFDIGGNSDIIIHKQNGYLAKHTKDLSNGIIWCLKNLDTLSKNARKLIVYNFDYNTITKHYIQQYQKMVRL